VEAEGKNYSASAKILGCLPSFAGLNGCSSSHVALASVKLLLAI